MQRAIRALPLLLFLLFALFFNTNLVNVRVSELNYLLEDASGAQEVLNNSAILGRFELLKRRLAQGESLVENYELEARIQALTAPGRSFASNAPAAFGPLARSLRAVLNGLRFMMGKGAIHPETEDATLGALEVAYLRERSRSYREALGDYLRVLPQLPSGTELRATAMLHVAFCDSMLNSISSARVTLTDVISENPGKEQSLVAWKLLDFLDFLQQKRGVSLPGRPTELDRARRAYQLVDYSASIDLLSEFIVTHKNDPNIAEAFYFRGRSHEELGELSPAIDDYRTVISHPSGIWTREAQRRLFLLGTIYGQGDVVARDALRGRGPSSQTAFVSAVIPYARIIDPSAVADWLTGSAAVAGVPAPRMTPLPASPPISTPGELPDGTADLAGARPVPEGGAAPSAADVAAAAAATPAPVSAAESPPAAVLASTENLFLPPLRMTPSPEPAAVPILESTLPGGTAASLLAERTALSQRYESEISVRRGYNVGSWISLGAGVASAGTMGYILYQAFVSYAQYQGATSFAQAQAMRQQTLFNSSMAITAGVVGGVALATALALQLIAPSPGPTGDRIRALDDAIDQLGRASR